MATDLAYFIGRPWGFALLVAAILMPRVFLRLKEPRGLDLIPRRLLFTGYCVAVAFALLVALLAHPLQLRSWPEATPIRSVGALMALSPVAKYLCAALIAWLTVAYLVAPVAAWLMTLSLANGLLLIGACLPLAGLLGLGSWAALPVADRTLPFNLASALALVGSTAVGFSLGARLPLTVRLHARQSAA